MTNTNEETKFSTSLPIYKINSNYKYEKTHTQGPLWVRGIFGLTLPRSWHHFPIRSPSKRTVVIFCSQKGQREFSACTWFQLTAQFDSKAEDLEAIGRDTTQAIEYENGKV